MADGVNYGRFRIKYLPKPEYKLMKEMVKGYGCKDESELIAVAIRVLSGHSYLEIITHLEYIRSTSEKERVYEGIPE